VVVGAGSVNAAWQAFSDELARWCDAGRTVDFWWRDDDAAQATPALARLLGLAQTSATPLALAVIPAHFEAEAFAQAGLMISLLQHGTDHRNRAAPGEKKTEFPAAEPVAGAVARLAAARARLAPHPRFLPVLAPPWNRLPEPLAAQLAAAGFQGLSRYGARAGALAAAGVVQVNTHIDLIAWRAGRGFAGDGPCLQAAVRHLAAKREGTADPGEATGWLSHHGVHDEEAWSFLERLLETTGHMSGVRWRAAPELFHAR
jgi:hypothetical protein